MNETCDDLCRNDGCTSIIKKNCSDMLFVPAVPILFGHVYFAYTKKEYRYSSIAQKPQYVCLNDQLCGKFFTNHSSLSFHGATCYSFQYFPQSNVSSSDWTTYVGSVYDMLFGCSSIVSNNSTLCNRSTMYQCRNSSKCISKYRLHDRIQDCVYNDDEQFFWFNSSCSLEQFSNHFKCTRGRKLCIAHRLVRNGHCDCLFVDKNIGRCEEEELNIRLVKNDILFQTICDGFIEMSPLTIEGRRETDETECEQWPCNNSYTRCDGHWNCLNGADEVDCDPSPLFKCPLRHHHCIPLETNQLLCLPIEKANDGIIDCVGATDEPQLCRAKDYRPSHNNFLCREPYNVGCEYPENVCYSDGICMYAHKLCSKRNLSEPDKFCNKNNSLPPSDAETFLCGRLPDKDKRDIIYFSLDRQRNSIRHVINRDDSAILPHLSMIRTTRQREQRCHRGLGLRVWLDSEQNLTSSTCLCPPSFYGDICQYQNQRVSLTMGFRALSDAWRTPFTIVVSLIDDGDERTIHSYEQFTYLPVRDCQIKFNVYLLYSTRSKNNTKYYSIHIDIYEKVSLTYRGSWLIPIIFPFLPVHRLAVQLDIPHSNAISQSCSTHQCVHGQCIKYSNNPQGITFCQCNRGWTGRHCTIPHTCSCSLGSLCIGVLADNRSMCVCPINRFGPRCLLDNPVCQFDATCLNNGHCIPIDEHLKSGRSFSCICPKGFTGDRCEIADTKIIVSFDKGIDLPQSMLVHFIQVFGDAPPERTTSFKTIPINQKSVTIQHSHSFHIAFVELFNSNYYLTVVQKTYHPSKRFAKTLTSSDRCENIREVLNETIVKLHLLRRIKYYHVPCRRRSPLLSCFYDDLYLCLCENYGQERHANCFNFDHQMKFDCFGESGCENGARCFQDSMICPQTSICACPTCFYGTRCQFSTSGFSLSLDAILGYHILPHASILHQPSAVQISAALAMVLAVAGLVDGVLSVITFKNKKLREVGCGFYLLASSITTLVTMTVFTLKVWILVCSQMALIENRSFLYVQCILIDFLLRICLSMDQWLSACVAIERAVTTKKGLNFDKKKSKQTAKWTIPALVLLTIGTAIHESFYRRLIDDDNGDEKRIWCSATYPPQFQFFNSAVNVFHLVVPFFINLISALTIITTNARQRGIVRTHQTYKQLLRETFQKHKHLLLGPCVLVVLACPRLILTFVSGCMKSARDSWLFLAGYYISFVPPILTFVLFVLPSKAYKEQFYNAINQYRRMI